MDNLQPEAMPAGVKATVIIKLEDGSFVVDEDRFRTIDEALEAARAELTGEDRDEEAEKAFMENYDSTNPDTTIEPAVKAAY